VICPKCKRENTECIEDMLQVGYIAEIYTCNDCKGTIEVVYDGKISTSTIKEYRYVTS
jgi:hypothetical protein